MSVYERGFRAYEGPLTPRPLRALVFARSALRDAFSSKIFLGLFILSLLWPLACVVLLYLRYNSEALAIFGIDARELLPIDASVFRDFYMTTQGSWIFLIVLVLGPALVSPDMRDNALALYLARPIARWDYVAGKLLVLVSLGSAVSWVPGLLLVTLQTYLEGFGWLRDNWVVVPGLVIGFLVWILVLSVVALALSAWVKWKPLAAILFIGFLVVLGGMARVFQLIYGSDLGLVIDPQSLCDVVWDQLFGVSASVDLPPMLAWSGLAAIVACGMALLFTRVKAYEVVR